MSGFTEPLELAMLVKREVKEEEFDNFLQEYLFETQLDKPGLEQAKNEISSSFTNKGGTYSQERKEAKESELREIGAKYSPSSK